MTFSPRLWFRRLVLLPLSPALCGLLTGCSFLGSPTEFKLTAPVQAAANGDSVIFKDPSESFNCPLWGGTISLATVAKSGGEGATRFTYALSKDRPRDDIVTLLTAAGVLSISGRGTYSLVAPHRTVAWNSLDHLAAAGARIVDARGERLSITPQARGRDLIRASGPRGVNAFVGLFLPIDGKVYFRQATFSSVAAAYVGESQHDCANWDNAWAAIKALQRMENTVPR